MVYEYLSSNSIGKVTIMRTAIFVYQKYFLFLFFFLLLIPGILGLLHAGFFLSDDGNWMVIRFSAFYEALRHGQFPVRFLPRLLNGYGYPVADFLYPLFMYIGVPIHILGANFITTIKILFGVSFILSGIFSYVWLKILFKKMPAVLGALVYTYFPYHLFDLYKRGSIGEMVALAIVPFVLWQIEKKHTAWVGLGIALLILAHNTLALLFLPVLITYYLLREPQKLHCIYACLFGLGIAAFFWIPALYDAQYTVFDTKPVSSIAGYFINSSTYYLLGFISAAGIVGGIVAIVRKNLLSTYFFIVCILSLFLSLSISEFMWNLLPLGRYVQFPFRFLSLSALSIGFLIAYMLSILEKKWKKAGIGVICMLLFFSVIKVLFPSEYQYYPESWYSTNQDSTTVQNEYLPRGVKQIPTNKISTIQLLSGQGVLSQIFSNGNKITLTAFMHGAGMLQVNTVYFPGWNINVDSEKTQVRITNNGLILVKLSKGTHKVVVYFTETPVRLMADIISSISVIALGWYFLKTGKK